MKNYILAFITISFFVKIDAQTLTEKIPNPNDSRVITTGMPFLLITSDARAAALGDMGVATSVDGYSQHWNQSKYVFSETKSGLGVSYTPYLQRLVNDIFLGNITYFNRIDDRSAFALSFKYFSLGEIELLDGPDDIPIIAKPNELTIDASYSLRLADQFSMAVGLRYLRSDLKIQQLDDNASAANSFAVDISGYYQGEETAYNDFNGRWRGGFAIQNLGPKIKYDDAGRENFLPTTLRLGGGFDFIFDEYNKLAVTLEVVKLLVPTPPILGTIREFEDNNGNGVYDEPDFNNPLPDDDVLISENEDVIISGKDPDVSFLKGVFQSFGDAPGGFSEDLQEVTWALGVEYQYQDSFALRAGYFHESDVKGARQFFALGAGFKYTTINIDFSYLFSTSKVQSPLEGTLRFSLTFNFRAKTYSEY
jgi:hypothetical protein